MNPTKLQVVQKFFFLDLNTAGLVILGFEILTTIFAFISWIATYQQQTILVLIAIIILGAFCGLAFYGINEKKHLLLLPWLILKALVYVILLLGIILLVVGAGGVRLPNLPIISLLAVILELALLFGLLIYAWLTVLALFIEIRQSNANASGNPANVETVETGPK